MIDELLAYLREQSTNLEELATKPVTSATYKEARSIAENLSWRLQDYLDDDRKRSLKEPENAKQFLEQFPTYDAWYDAVEDEFSNRTVLELYEFVDDECLKHFYADFEDPSDVVEGVMKDNDIDDL